MLISILEICLTLAIILYACHLFSNAIEWFGKKLGMGQGVVGSIFAALGTALPETMIPIIAILVYHDAEAVEIGLGAIVGAPFMLSSLAMFVVGTAIVIYKLLGKRELKMTANVTVFRRDMTFFIITYGIAVATTFVRDIQPIKIGVGIFLLLAYAFYVKRSFSDSGEAIGDLGPLILGKPFKVKEPSLTLVIVQLVISLVGIVIGAHMFVGAVGTVAGLLGISPLILSLIITPIATELPEKFNSIMWTGQKKDTLALGNMSGAMVFQSCIPVFFGIVFTSWNLDGPTMLSAGLALISAAILLAYTTITKKLHPFMLMFGGVIYLIFILNVL